MSGVVSGVSGTVTVSGVISGVVSGVTVSGVAAVSTVESVSAWDIVVLGGSGSGSYLSGDLVNGPLSLRVSVGGEYSLGSAIIVIMFNILLDTSEHRECSINVIKHV